MARKKKIKYDTYVDSGITYMVCNTCGVEYTAISETAISVKCWKCVHNAVGFPTGSTKRYKPTGRPAGWHWMKEFVDKDGNVFHKGKEQPKLKGTLPPTKVTKKKIKRRTKVEIERDKIKKYRKKKKSALKKAVKKQKDFLNHKFDKDK